MGQWNSPVQEFNNVQELYQMQNTHFQDMQMKITLLITENERLIHINEGLMRENESLKHMMNDNSKIANLTTANDQLRQMIK